MEKLCNELERISWSYKSYTANELNATKCFPMIVKISSSGLGNRFYEDYSTDQILYLYSVKRQFRFLAYDTKGNEISVPSTFLLNENGGILKAGNVLLGKDLEIPNEKDNSYTIKKEGWMKYLVGTCITEDGIISKKIECIPVKCNNLYFKVALNIGDGSKDRLAVFVKKIHDLVQTTIPDIQFNSYQGNTEIVVNAQPNLIDIEEEIPLSTSSQSFKGGHRYEKISDESLINPYCELRKEKTNEEEKTYSNSGMERNPSCLKSTEPKHQGKNDIQEKDPTYEFLYEEVRKNTLYNNELKKDCYESKQRCITDVSKDSPYLEPIQFLKDQYHPERPNKQCKNPVSLNRQPELMNSPQEVSSRSPPYPRNVRRDLPPIPKSADRALPPIPTLAHRDLPPIPNSGDKDLPPIPKSGDKDLPPIPKSADRDLPPIPKSGDKDLPPIPKSSDKDLPPIPKLGDRKSITKPIHSKNDLPDKLQMLSVEQVGNCLELMQLNKHVENFRKNSIDGSILCDLTEDILTNDFGLKNVEALKLRKFINERWLPIL